MSEAVADAERERTEEAEATSLPPPEKRSGFRAWMEPETRSRRLLVALGIYLVCLVVYAVVAGDRLWVHTANNHFAFLADAWLHGRQDLGGPPPAHSQGNDWALFEGKWYVSFPPFPAMLMAPLVWVAKDPDNFRDAQFIVWLAGIGPAVLFLALEKLRRTGRSTRSEVDGIRLALLFAFGTVYFFSAVQGSVWFAAHVVGVGLMALFVLFALDAERPALAGLMIGLLFLTRTTTLLVAVFFAFEVLRAAYMHPREGPARALPTEGPLLDRVATVWRDADKGVLGKKLSLFVVPVLACLAFASWLNAARFHDPRPWAFGHEFLQVGWQFRIQRWGLFSYHYLGRNLSAMLAGLPWTPPPKTSLAAFGGVPFKINGHGLALWFTSPFYLWLVRPKRMGLLGWGALAAAAGPLVMNLLYQNSGWVQFGYRFSNDYAVFLFVLLAIGSRRMGPAFWACAIWAVAWNVFGAATFDRNNAYYAFDSEHVYQPD
jgi:hypothetical protein